MEFRDYSTVAIPIVKNSMYCDLVSVCQILKYFLNLNINMCMSGVFFPLVYMLPGA